VNTGAGRTGEPVAAAVRAGLAACPPGPVLIAVSGGPDSLALAHAASRAVGNRPVAAAVVDHQLSAGSAAVAAAAAGVCRDWGLHPVAVLTVRADGAGGVEAAARRARYTALDDAAHAGGAVAVLLGHTRDDQAETLLLGLARGSGLRVLRGMRPVDGLWRRPLLAVPRAATRAYCEDWGVAFHEDPMNDDPRFARVRVRRTLAALHGQLGEGFVAGLARTAELLADDDEALTGLAATAGQAAANRPDGSLDVQVLAALPRALRTRVLRSALIGAGCPAGALTRDHVAGVEALISHWRGQGGPGLPGGVLVARDSGRLHLRGPETTGPAAH